MQNMLIYFKYNIFVLALVLNHIMLQQIQRDAEVTAEDEQVFLMRQQTQLSKQPPAGARQVSGSSLIYQKILQVLVSIHLIRNM